MRSNWFPITLFFIIAIVVAVETLNGNQKRNIENKEFADYLASEKVDTVWRGWNKYQIPYNSDSGKLIWYGHELISNTSYYLTASQGRTRINTSIGPTSRKNRWISLLAPMLTGFQ